MSSNRWKYVSIILFIVLVSTSILSIQTITSLNDELKIVNKELNKLKDRYSQLIDEFNSLKDQLGQNFNPKIFYPKNSVYSQLGYPKITYTGYLPYSTNEPNYTYILMTRNTYFELGTLQAPVISFSGALKLATTATNLDSTKYSLLSADFQQGYIVNGTIDRPPFWYFFFERTYQDFFVYSSRGIASVFIMVDALNGNVTSYGLDYNDPNMPTEGERYELKVDSKRALNVVRASNLKDIPKFLTINGTVTNIELKIILLSQETWNPFDTSLLGKKRLCWIIRLYSPVPSWGYQGYFAVDAETGELVGGAAQSGFPPSAYFYMRGSVNFSLTKNLAVSKQTFSIDGDIVERNGKMQIAVPNVLIIKPGTSGSITLDIESRLQEDVECTMTMANPLVGYQKLNTDNSPPGITIQSTQQKIPIPGNKTSRATLLITAHKDAPQKTYLLELNITYNYPKWDQPSYFTVLFLLTVWSGEQQWPPPPIIEKE